MDTKSINWKLYKYIKNEHSPGGSGVDLSTAKVMLISSAGAYLPTKDKPFNASNLLGDYSIRTFPSSTKSLDLDYAHNHYDQTAVRKDMQVLLPLEHLKALVQKDVIGAFSDIVISFMGYQPWVGKVIKKTIPAILETVKHAGVDAVFLVPS